jgi:hypothetical protein
VTESNQVIDRKREKHSPSPAVLALASRRTPRLAIVLAIALIDSFIWWAPIPRPLFGLLDEFGHLTTVILLLSAWRPLPTQRRPFLVATLAASVLIDIDHIPSEVFHSDVLMAGTYRPYGHTLLVILTIAGLSRVLPGRGRPIAAGIAVGFCLHLVRDLATGGASLLWPVGNWTIWYPYPIYVALLLFTALRPARPPVRDGSHTVDAERLDAGVPRP